MLTITFTRLGHFQLAAATPSSSLCGASDTGHTRCVYFVQIGLWVFGSTLQGFSAELRKLAARLEVGEVLVDMAGTLLRWLCSCARTATAGLLALFRVGGGPTNRDVVTYKRAIADCL